MKGIGSFTGEILKLFSPSKMIEDKCIYQALCRFPERGRRGALTFKEIKLAGELESLFLTIKNLLTFYIICKLHSSW